MALIGAAEYPKTFESPSKDFASSCSNTEEKSEYETRGKSMQSVTNSRNKFYFVEL